MAKKIKRVKEKSNAKMPTVAVLGANGFIGSHIVSFLKKKGHTVTAIARTFSDGRKPLWEEADTILEVDLQDESALVSALQNIDWVIHLAADMGGVGYFHSHNYTPFVNNMRVDLNVFEACRKAGVTRLFYASSACVYPTHLMAEESKALHLREDMIFPANADQMYGWGKLMGLLLAQHSPIDVRVGILHTIFGEYQDTTLERMKFPTAIAKKVLDSKLSGGPIEIWGNGKQLRTFCYIADALEKIYLVISATKNHTPVNIGSDELLSVKDVADVCCEIVGIQPEYTFNLDKPSGALSRGCDNSKFEEIYNYKNVFTTKQGFEKLIAWMNSMQF